MKTNSINMSLKVLTMWDLNLILFDEGNDFDPLLDLIWIRERILIPCFLSELEFLWENCCYPFLKYFWKTIAKNNENPKSMFLIYLHCFQHFQHCLKRIQISNVFSIRWAFNALFLKSLIFLIESMLILLFLKKKSKYKCWTKQLGKKEKIFTYK
jgi:hypothetical protein